MPDWYRDHPHVGPQSDAEYLDWAQDNGLYVDAAGNVDYWPPEATDRCAAVRDAMKHKEEALHQVQPLDGQQDTFRCSCGPTFESDGGWAVCPHVEQTP